MTRNDTATIVLTSGDTELRFSWLQYDGDDCFNSHIVDFASPDQRFTHDYKECHVRSPRIITEILDANHGDKGFGFRVPEIVYYDVKLVDGVFTYRANSDELPREISVSITGFTLSVEQSWKTYWGDGV